MQLHVMEMTLLTFILSVVGVLAIAGPLTNHIYFVDFYYNDAVKNRVETYGLPAVFKNSSITVVPYFTSGLHKYFLEMPDCDAFTKYE